MNVLVLKLHWALLVKITLHMTENYSMHIMQSPPRTPIGQVHVCLYQLVCFPQVVNRQKLKRYLNRGKNEHEHNQGFHVLNLNCPVDAVHVSHQRPRLLDLLHWISYGHLHWRACGIRVGHCLSLGAAPWRQRCAKNISAVENKVPCHVS